MPRWWYSRPYQPPATARKTSTGSGRTRRSAGPGRQFASAETSAVSPTRPGPTGPLASMASARQRARTSHVDPPVARLVQELRRGGEHERGQEADLLPAPGAAGEEDEEHDQPRQHDRRRAQRVLGHARAGERGGARREPVEEGRLRGHDAPVPEGQDPVAGAEHLAHDQPLARLATLVDVRADGEGREHDGERDQRGGGEDGAAHQRSLGAGQPWARQARGSPRRRRAWSSTWPERSTARTSIASGVTCTRR